MIHVKSSSGELYYLRLLLLHLRGSQATSWQALRRSPSHDCEPTHEHFARELGLLQDDVELFEMLSDAVHVVTSTQKLCNLMAETLVWLDVSDPVSLWQHFVSLMAQQSPQISGYQLYLLVASALSSYSLTLQEFAIPVPPGGERYSLQSKAAKEYDAEVREGSQLEEERRLADSLPLNDAQLKVFEAV